MPDSTEAKGHRGGALAMPQAFSPPLPTPRGALPLLGHLLPLLRAPLALLALLALLAQHPDVAHPLRTEVDTVLDGWTAAYDDLPRLHLTARVVNETLRLWPPVWAVPRVVTTDTRLGGHDLPAGTLVVYSPYLVHLRPELYGDPERLDPDRWMPGPTAPPREACVPFGGGARKCIGDTFGLTEATLALATITHHWHLEPLPGQRVRRPVPGGTLRPSPFRMRAIRRPWR
ncbi:cytochrome P450 [Streptomyces sp. NPDC048506]|uniref:cytochrome P450 n=1 Tax=Streptomyces sp. NPDC048506 TaxID=3155028 RepID=UPI00341F167D